MSTESSKNVETSKTVAVSETQGRTASVAEILKDLSFFIAQDHSNNSPQISNGSAGNSNVMTSSNTPKILILQSDYANNGNQTQSDRFALPVGLLGCKSTGSDSFVIN